MKLLPNDGSLIDKKLMVETGRVYFFDQSGDIQSYVNDEPHNLFELPYFDQTVKVFKVNSLRVQPSLGILQLQVRAL